VNGALISQLFADVIRQRVQRLWLQFLCASNLESAHHCPKFEQEVIIGEQRELAATRMKGMQTGRIHLPKQEAAALEEELYNFELKVRSTGTLEMGALRTGKHDDLVNALGLGVY
jgi:hypothetical protein